LRLLFASVHGSIDPRSGAATVTRAFPELLAALGHDCRVLSTGVLDPARETAPGPTPAGPGVPVRRARAAARSST
jgi:hypothetical protein